MGDVVNVSARIESTTKNFGTDLLVSEQVAQVAPHIALLEAGEIMLKGKSSSTKLFAIAGDEQIAGTAEFLELARLHRWLLDSLSAGDAQAGATALAACRAAAPDELQGLYGHFADAVAGGGGEPAQKVG
jgi:adenylate cyclase